MRSVVTIFRCIDVQLISPPLALHLPGSARVRLVSHARRGPWSSSAAGTLDLTILNPFAAQLFAAGDDYELQLRRLPAATRA